MLLLACELACGFTRTIEPNLRAYLFLAAQTPNHDKVFHKKTFSFFTSSPLPCLKEVVLWQYHYNIKE